MDTHQFMGGLTKATLDAIGAKLALSDYSKRTAFTTGTVKTNFGRFPLSEKLRFLTRAAVRHVVG